MSADPTANAGPPGAEWVSTVEAAVTDSWTEVLGYPPDGSAANFFEDGGNSLVAVDLLAGIKQRLDRSLKLQELYSAPTVGELVAVLIAELDGVPAAHHATGRTVVPLRRAGAGRLWCFLPPLSGAVTRYASMARLLPLADGVWACETPAELSAQGLAALAEGLAEALRERGLADFELICLVGYSLGGVLAVEVARALRNLPGAGAHRLAVQLLDPVGPDEPVADQAELFELFVRNGWQLGQPAAAFRRPDGSPDLAAVADAARAAGTLPGHAELAEVERAWAVYLANAQLMPGYRPAPLPADVPVTLLRCVGENAGDPGWQPASPPDDWRTVVPADRCWQLPVDHFALLESPHDRVVAGWLTATAPPS